MAFDVVTYALCKKFTSSEIAKVIESLSEGMKFKGSVNSIEDLPSGASEGDLYIVKNPGCKAVYFQGEWVTFDNIPSLEGYATESWVESKGYLTEHQDISGKADKTEIAWEKGEGLHSTLTKGNNNQAKGEASVAEGAEVDAHAYASHAEGYMTSTGVSADYSHTEGYKTSTQGVASHAEGDNTVTNNPAEHAEGKYNKSNMGGTPESNTIHSIGIGNASGSIPGGERKNAFEVMQSGDAYLVGVGNYDGKNYSSAKTIQEVINSKQEPLSAGKGIIIKNNAITYDEAEISSVEYVDANISDTMAYVIQEDRAEHAGRVAGDELLQAEINKKQNLLTAGDNVTITSEGVISATDTTYVAGEHITIEGNVISSTGGSALMEKSFNTRATVGLLPEGSYIDENDSVAKVLYKILYGETSSMINLYYGASDELPVDKNNLSVIKDQDVDYLLQNGKVVKIITGNVETGEGQYPVFACDKGAKLVSVETWKADGFDYPIPFVSVDKGNYFLYYLETQTYDEDLGGTTYRFTFKEGN